MYVLPASHCEIDESKTELILRFESSLVILQNPSLLCEYPFWPQTNAIIQLPFETRIPAVYLVAVQLLI